MARTPLSQMMRLISSVCLLYLSFPNVFSLSGYPFFAWFFAVPFFCALEGEAPMRRALLGLLWGLLAHGAIANWFFSYSVPGFIFFIFLLSVQSVLFAVLFSPGDKGKRASAIFVPACWVVSEYARSFLMRGFSWNVGHSQAFHLVFIQAADILGSYGVSFALLAVNVCLYNSLRGKKKDMGRVFIPVVAVLAFLFFYGINAVDRHGRWMSPGTHMSSACLVQPNVDFREKSRWDQIPAILEKNLQLSEQCFGHGPVDTVLWPETAIPGDLRQENDWQKKLADFVQRRQISLVAGAALKSQGRDHNSVVWFKPDGTLQEVYRKRFLIPFSEYVPLGRIGQALAKQLGWQGYQFFPGKNHGVALLSLRPSQKVPAGFLICSEDAVAENFRQDRQAGAGIMFVFLNDGWFRQPAGMNIHLQQAVMHAVENRIPVVRVSNNGWSGLISPEGRVYPVGLPFYQEGARRLGFYPYWHQTFYTRFGDIFCWFCLGFVIITVIQKIIFRRPGCP